MAQKHGWIPVCKENDQRRAVRGTHAHRASRMGKGLSFLKFRFNPKATRVALLSAFQLDWLPLHSCVPLRERQNSRKKETQKDSNTNDTETASPLQGTTQQTG